MDHERRNRNPKPERRAVSRDIFFDTHPVVDDLDAMEINRVYVLVSEGHMSTWNYSGRRPVMNAMTLDTVLAYTFLAPRILQQCALIRHPLGGLQDSSGARIEVRRWTGEDA